MYLFRLQKVLLIFFVPRIGGVASIESLSCFSRYGSSAFITIHSNRISFKSFFYNCYLFDVINFISKSSYESLLIQRWKILGLLMSTDLIYTTQKIFKSLARYAQYTDYIFEYFWFKALNLYDYDQCIQYEMLSVDKIVAILAVVYCQGRWEQIQLLSGYTT